MALTRQEIEAALQATWFSDEHWGYEDCYGRQHF
jgi:hypothetical protein